MLTGRFGQVLRRQWVLVVLGVLVTAGLAGGVAWLKPPGYLVTATALVLPPKEAADGTQVNPYLQLGGLTSATDVLARALNDPTVHDRIIGVGVQGDFTAERDFLTSAPILLVSAEAPTEAAAREIRDDVLAAAPQVLSGLQADVGVPAGSRLTVETISSDGTTQVQYKPLLRLMLLVVAAGLVATVLLAGAADAWSARRRSRPSRHEAVLATGAGLEEPVPQGVHGSAGQRARDVRLKA